MAQKILKLIFILNFSNFIFIYAQNDADKEIDSFFTSQFHLENIYFKIHNRVTSNLIKNIYFQNFTNLGYENEKIQKMKGMAHSFIIRQFLKSPFLVTSNPINAFKFVKAMTVDLLFIEHTLNEKFKFYKYTNLQLSEKECPTLEDFIGASDALNRLIMTYHLNLSDVANGKLGKFCCAEKLNYHDFFVLGKRASSNNQHKPTILIFEYLLENYYLPKYKAKIPLKHFEIEHESYYEDLMNDSEMGILALYMKSIKKEFEKKNPEFQTEDALGKLKIVKQFLDLNDGNAKFDKVSKKYNKMLNFLNSKNNWTNLKNIKESKEKKLRRKFNQLCRGEVQTQKKKSSNLKCQLVHKNEPFLLIGPYKEEIVHENPKVAIFHDFLLTKESDLVISAAKLKLERSVVYTKDQKTSHATFRISKTAFLDPNQGLIPNKRISYLTNLDVNTEQFPSEHYQVVNYGLGGFYNTHYDQIAKTHTEENFVGNRIATFLIFLSDVEAGGATVFPYLDLSIFPKKGSAIIWHNLLEDGERDDSMLHGGCPVLIGSKWITNIWIRNEGQEFKRKCGLKPSFKFKHLF